MAHVGFENLIVWRCGNGHGLSVDSIEVRASVGSRLSARIARFVQSRDRSSPMKQPISPLRQRMIDDMTMRTLSANTQETYIRSVAQFSAFHRRSPDKLGVEHVRDFHLHLVSRGLAANSIAVKMAALRFFYGTTLRRLDIAAEIPTPRRPDRLPTVLARAEVERLLKAVEGGATATPPPRISSGLSGAGRMRRPSPL